MGVRSTINHDSCVPDGGFSSYSPRDAVSLPVVLNGLLGVLNVRDIFVLAALSRELDGVLPEGTPDLHRAEGVTAIALDRTIAATRLDVPDCIEESVDVSIGQDNVFSSSG